MFPIRIIKVALSALVVLVALGVSVSPALAGKLSPELEAALHLKIMSFEKFGQAKAIVIVVIYDPNSRISAQSADDAERAFNYLAKKKRVTVHGKAVHTVSIPYDEDLEAELARMRANVIFVGPGLDDEISGIAEAARSLRLPTHCGDRNYLNKGLAIAVVAKGDRPSMVIHTGNAREAGVVIDSNLLRIAEIIK